MTKMKRRDFIVTGAAAGIAFPMIMKQSTVKPLVIASANGNRFKNGGNVTAVQKAFQMMTNGADELACGWSPNGTLILFASNRDNGGGVNNRDLKTFTVDIERSIRLIGRIPKDKLLIAESGIDKVETIWRMQDAGFHGFLIGERFMKEENPAIAFAAFVEQLKMRG